MFDKSSVPGTGPGRVRPPLLSAGLSRRAALAGVLSLAGCVAAPIVFDRANLASIKRLGVLVPGFPDQPTVAVPSPTNGALFLLINAAQRDNRSREFAEFIVRAGTNPEAEFSKALLAGLREASLQPASIPADPRRAALLREYAPVTPPGVDAVMDVVVRQYGYYAVTQNDPFKPMVTMQVRMVDARSRAVLMQETIGMVNVAPADPAIATASFQDYSDIAANPAGAARALQSAMDTAAATVCRRLA